MAAIGFGGMLLTLIAGGVGDDRGSIDSLHSGGRADIGSIHRLVRDPDDVLVVAKRGPQNTAITPEAGAGSGGLPDVSGPDRITGLICGLWVDDCEHALRVFSCEVGNDYIDGDPYDKYVGVAQIDVNLHGWRFIGDPYEPAENLRVAFQLFQERAWAPWPNCRWR